MGIGLGARCAPALREPPPIDQLSRSRGPGQLGREELAVEAEGYYARRTLWSVRRAAEIWLAAAGADVASAGAWVGATRALVWLADHLPSRRDRREAATSAVHSAQWCQRTAPRDGACLYWLAVALGIQARERRATATDALPRIVALLEQAIATDPLVEQAGPHRVLALVYLRAPGWPVGPGDPDLGLAEARRAVELGPAFPPNRLALAEALAATGDPAASRRAYEQALEIARERSERGEPDAGEWVREAETALGLLERR